MASFVSTQWLLYQHIDFLGISPNSVSSKSVPENREVLKILLQNVVRPIHQEIFFSSDNRKKVIWLIVYNFGLFYDSSKKFGVNNFPIT